MIKDVIIYIYEADECALVHPVEYWVNFLDELKKCVLYDIYLGSRSLLFRECWAF